MMSIHALRCFVLLGCLAAGAAAAEPSADAEAVVPHQVVKLFNGKDLDGWQTWLKGSGRDDPEMAFSVEDGMIRVSGEGVGYLATDRPYKDYHLALEYKWGTKTDGSKYVRNSGVLLHGIGPDGGAGGAWMTSIECQLAQGCEGDLIVIRGKDAEGNVVPATITSETTLAADKRTRWLKGGAKTVYSGKQFWWSSHEPFFEELRDTRGKDDAASPLGQWTKVDCICEGDRITIRINGRAVNECFDSFPSAGRILLQNEGNEIYFRNVELRPLGEE